MEQIKHTHVQVNSLKLHVAEIGTGPKVVLFLHGFPQIWYTWRHQMIPVADAGYRAIAIDFRGYGQSEQPPESEQTSFNHFADDVIALLDTMSIDKVFLVGTDFGSIVAYQIGAVNPERVIGIVSLGIPFMIPGPDMLKLDLFPKGFYIIRWQEPGRAEADFGRFDVKTVIKNIYIMFSRSEVPVAGDDDEVMDLVDPSTPLPDWFSEDDLQVYTSLYEKSGFSTALKVPYRTLVQDCGIIDPKVMAPTLLLMGEKDYVHKFPGIEEFIRSGEMRNVVTNLEITYLPQGKLLT